MTTEDFRMDLEQGRDYEKALVRQELEEMEREAERDADRARRTKAAVDKVIERLDHLKNVEGQCHTFYDPIWMDAYAILGDAYQRLVALDAHERLVALEREGL